MKQTSHSLDVLHEVLRLIEATLGIPAEEIDIDASMETFGVNSLIVMELMENIERAFDVTLTVVQFADIDTVRAMAGLLEKLLAEQQSPAVSAPIEASASASISQAVEHGPGTSPALLGRVRERFGLPVAEVDFGSVKELADALVRDHGATLLRYYGLDGRDAATERVAIVGMSCRLPDAEDPRAFWRNLLERRNSMREIPSTRWDWREHYAQEATPGKTVSRWGGLIDDVDCFDADFFGIPAGEAASMDPQLRLLLEESYHAIEDAGIPMPELAGSRTGVFVGYEYTEYEHHLRRLGNQDFTQGPLFSSSSPSYYLANRISHAFDLCGPSEACNVNCASSAVAMNRAVRSLLEEESDLALVGAASLNLFAADYVAASQYGVLSPDGSCGVFDDDANGFTRGEGVAVVVLKRLSEAERDGDRIYGVVRCTHANHRGAARNISEVRHEAITRVLQDCYVKAGVAPESIDYVEVDGYASRWADSFEYEGIKNAFAGSAAQRKHVALGSVKGNIGNTEPVSGLVNVIKLTLALHHGRFPATISVHRVNRFLDVDEPGHPLYLADDEIPFGRIRGDDAARPIRAGINSFADSGSNVHILLEEYRDEYAETVNSAAHPQLFVLSARDPERLIEYVRRFLDYLDDEENTASLVQIVHSAQVGRAALPARLAIVVGARQELRDKLAQVVRYGLQPGLGMESRGVFYGEPGAEGANPLARLITEDMVRMQLGRCVQDGQWTPLAKLWVGGVAVPWRELWQGQRIKRVSLPTYPFARVRHWMDTLSAGTAATAPVATVAAVAAAMAPVADMGGDTATWHVYRPRASMRPVLDAGEFARAEKLTLFLRQEVGAALGRCADEVALDQDFIALGMNSVDIAALIVKLDALLHIHVAPAVLFRHPDIGSLADYLADAYAQAVDALVVTREAPVPEDVMPPPGEAMQSVPKRTTPADILVSLQSTGSLEPIFAVPGAGGNALSLQQLSHALGEEQPFYSLDPVGLDGAAPMTDIATIAAFNLAALRTVRPYGPYRLLGYSNGGVVAFEMARQLQAEGEQVSSLVLLDSLSPAQREGEGYEMMTTMVFNHFIAALGAQSGLSVEEVAAIPPAERGSRLYEYAVGLGLALPRAQFLATFDVAIASEAACRAYRPEPLAAGVDVLLVQARDDARELPPDYGWAGLVGAGLRVCSVAANHFDLVEREAVAQIARLLAPAASAQAVA